MAREGTGQVVALFFSRSYQTQSLGGCVAGERRENAGDYISDDKGTNRATNTQGGSESDNTTWAQ